MLKKIFFAAVLLTAASVYAADGINVVDGDSLEVGNERLRLMNIDAPEFFQKCHDASGWKYLCGFEAAMMPAGGNICAGLKQPNI